MKDEILKAIRNAIDLNADGKIDEKDLLEIIKLVLPLLVRKAQKNALKNNIS